MQYKNKQDIPTGNGVKNNNKENKQEWYLIRFDHSAGNSQGIKIIADYEISHIQDDSDAWGQIFLKHSVSSRQAKQVSQFILSSRI